MPLGYGYGSRVLIERPDRFILTLNTANDSKVLNALGGVLVHDQDGKILGASGIEAIGLLADIG